MTPVPLVEVVRGGLREGVHHGSLVVLAPDGSVLRSVGDVDSPMYPRSSNKPVQAAGMLRTGLDLPEPADLALAAASHSGEPGQVSRVLEILHRNGLGEDDLRCPPTWPGHEGSRDALIASGAERRRAAMECSGKHAAMLAACVRRGWPTGDYLDPEHPLQVALHETLADLAGEPVAATAVDGCGAPLLAISLRGLARAFSAVVTAAAGTPERRVADAMREHPWLVAGADREDTLLMRAVPGLLSKSGAEGVLALALPDGRAVAAKVSDGAARARQPIAVGALGALGVHGTALDALAEPPVLGGGAPAGSVRLISGVL